MNWSFPIAKVKGIEIRVHFTFALVLLWAAFDWGVSRGLGLTGALYGVAFVSLLFLCVTLHELGHSLVARHYGVKVRDITLLPIGGVARLEGELTRPMQEFWMALAGPAVNVALAVILGAVTLPLLGWRALDGLSLLLSRLNEFGLERLLVDLLAGVIDITNEGSSLPHAKAGKLTLLNVNHFERFAEFPDVPTLSECGIKDADVPVWFALYAPPGMPNDIVEKVNAKANEISQTPEMKAILQAVSAVPIAQNLPDLRRHWEADIKSISELIKAANIKID